MLTILILRFSISGCLVFADELGFVQARESCMSINISGISFIVLHIHISILKHPLRSPRRNSK